MVPFYVVNLLLSLANPPGLDRFHAWLDDSGVERRARIEQDGLMGGGRGLVATEKIQPGETIIRVPTEVTLRIKGELHDHDDNWAGALATMMNIEQSLGCASTFEPYLSLGLPLEAPSTPCRWTSADRLALQNHTLVAESMENSIWRQTQFLRSGVKSRSSFMTSLDLVCSRTLKGRDGSRQLVPLIDIANHSPEEAGGGHFKVESDAVYLIAGSRGVEAGKAVTMDYGARSIDDFLMHYGFVPERCTSDSVCIVVLGKPTTISWRDCHGYRGHHDVNVRSACAAMLQSFPTSLDEDVRLLSSIKGYSPLSLALAYRYAKKSLLQSAIGVSDASSSTFSFGGTLATVEDNSR